MIFKLNIIRVLAVVCLLPVKGFAQESYSVNVGDNLKIISQGVTGVGMLDRASSSGFAKDSQFKNAIRDFGAGSLRWPNAGHDNLLITHWDNDHTIYYDDNQVDPYSTLAPGNIWDPNYDPNNAAQRSSEMIDLDAFVDVSKSTNTDPLMLFTWRSGELWSLDQSGKEQWYRDPVPLRMNGDLIPAGEAQNMSGREMQFLENRRQLQEYFSLGGVENPVVQIGGEVFLGWDDGFKPWERPEINQSKGEWVSSTLRLYFDDLSEYSDLANKDIRLMSQFKEANMGGKEIPTPVPFLRGEFDQLIESTGDVMSFYGCSMHYRHTWDEWLEEEDMTWAFITDQGQGTAAEIRSWLQNYVSQKGYPGIDLIPHANGLSHNRANTQKNTSFQKGLINTQFLMELIEAGYQYAHHFGGESPRFYRRLFSLSHAALHDSVN